MIKLFLGEKLFMTKKFIKLKCNGFIFIFLLFLLSHTALANEQDISITESRDIQEKKQIDNPFTISLYEPTYILPLAYSTGYNNYSGNNPDKRRLNKLEFDFKLSFKVPVVTNILHKDNTLYIAYTQSSFWQLYRESAFFRNSDYKPEIFFSQKPL